MKRSTFLRAAPLIVSMLSDPARAAETGVTDSSVLLGQTVAMSGPLGEFGRDIASGAKACLERINAAGGIHGRKLSLVTLDDQYKTDVAVQNITRLIQGEKVFSLLSVMGTAISLEAVRQAEAVGVPLFAPWTGVQVVRQPPRRHVFNVRASYKDEILKIVAHLKTIGTRKVAVVFFESSFSNELQSILDEMAHWPAKPVSISTIRPDGQDVDRVVNATAKAQPEAIILLTAGKTTVDFIKAYNAPSKGTQYYALSIMGTNASVQALGQDGVGVIVSSVVPFPWASGVPIVKEYQDAMQKIGVGEFSFTSLESYINTRVLVEAIRRAGKDLTRAKLVAAAESMRPLQLGGFEVGYGTANRSGSRYVDLNIISSGGRFMK
ncbi:ABC transporter substrate-binding protein [Caenimonas soli]|uniref:ABC transporter substrate-binding protein n=1 Tax=Caenimonas soli TaxID=2735555 RepID=UPI001551C7BA|nr:ABC transporter substrate-binding protein [Caenimonas soli]NPC59017.1 ABC transporter substrate-binding protein [Caenimonas soli]